MQLQTLTWVAQAFCTYWALVPLAFGPIGTPQLD
jgi:hypothetical protein